MKVAVIHVELKPGKLEAYKLLWKKAASTISREDGLVNIALLTQPDGRCLALGFWDSAEQAKAFQTKPAYQEFITGIRDLLAGPARREVYDVAAGDLSGLERRTMAA